MHTRTRSVNRIWLMAILLTVVMAGCGREQAATTASTLSTISPTSGAQGQSVNVTLTGTGFASGATINLSGTGITVSNTTVVSSTQITATFVIAASAPPVAQNVTVATAGTTIVFPNDDQTFTVTGVAPQVSSTNPSNFLICEPINREITVAFTKAMNPLTITTATFLVTGITPVTGTVAYDATNNIAIFTPTSNLGLDDIYTATITTSATDTTGNPLGSNFSWSFQSCTTADTTAPTVSSTVPANTAAAVPINLKAITATFSEGMDSRTLTATTFTVTGPGTTPVTGTVTYAGNAGAIATFTPAGNLAANTTYTVTVTAGAKDLAGNVLSLVGGLAPDPWTFTTGAASNTTSPKVISTAPASAATGVGINQTVNATFSEAINPLTITTATFTLTGPGPGLNPVTGTVSYNAASNVATFTPASNLAPSATYTATISTGVKDTSGNALVSGAAPNPWTFTTGTTATLGPVSLGSAAPFGGAGGGAGMTNQGTHTVVNGNITTTGASTTVTGFHDTSVPYTPPSSASGCTYTETTLNQGTVNGTIYTAAPPPTVSCPNEGTTATFSIAQQAVADAQTAYNTLAGIPGGTDPGAGQLGGLTLAPGVYKAALGSFLITGSDLTLDAQGNANAVWVFQMASTLTVGAAGAPRSVILINGAQAKNVFWQVGSAATINGAGGGTMVGTIIASSGVTFSTAGNVTITTLNGRALGLNASVTVVNTVINVPLP